MPGDPIVGFVTRGQGVSIHRMDCPNYQISLRNHEEDGRWITVSWAPQTGELYTTSLRILARDRNSLVVDIATVLSMLNAKVRSLNARSAGDGTATINVTLEVPDLEALRVIINRLNGVAGVQSVQRGGV